MKTLAARTPAVSEVDILMDMGLVQIDQHMSVTLSAFQYGWHLFEEGLAPFGVGAAE
jgi:hypothetical protein